MSDELKPCPFCGSDAVLTNERMSDKRFRVGCYNDACWRPGTDWYDSASAVVDAWNRRVGEPDGAALVREELDVLHESALDHVEAVVGGTRRTFEALFPVKDPADEPPGMARAREIETRALQAIRQARAAERTLYGVLSRLGVALGSELRGISVVDQAVVAIRGRERGGDTARIARAVFEYLHERISLGRLAELTGLNQAEWDRLVTIPGVLARERMAVLAFVDAFDAWWATDPEVGINEGPDDLLRRFLATRQRGG